MATLILAVAAPAAALAEASYVYHERTTNNPGCGSTYVSILTPNSTQSVDIRFKIEFQFYTDNARLYYTTDGSTPSGSLGVGAGSTQVIAASYDCTFGSPLVDVAKATIPAQRAGTTVKYIVSAWHSPQPGGGNEIFANGPGTPCSCGAPTNSSALATVFSYTVQNNLTGFCVWQFETSSLSASIGSGTASRTGSTLVAAATPFPGGASPTAVASMSSSGFVASDSESGAFTGNRFIEFDPTGGTTGYSNIGFVFDAQSSSTGANGARVYYSTDGTNFVAGGSAFTVSIAASYAGSPFYADLSSITALNNNPNAKFRIYAWGTGTGVTSAGTFRLDNVGVLGSSTAQISYNTAMVGALTTPVLGTGSTSYRLIQVNSNPNSPYYGYVYACDQQAAARVRIFRPDDGAGNLPAQKDRTAATKYVDTTWTAQTITPTAFSPSGLAIDPADDSIWMMDSGVGTVIIERAVHPTAGTPNTIAAEVFRPTGGGVTNVASTTLSGAMPSNTVATTTATTAMTTSSTTATLTTVTGLATSGRILVENEQMDYSGIVGTTLTITARGVNGTTAAAHAIGVAATYGFVPLTGTTGFPSGGGRIVVNGAEQIDYTALNTTAKALTTLTRGVNGTSGAAHSSGETVSVSPALVMRSMSLTRSPLDGTGRIFLGNTSVAGGDAGRFGFKQNPDLTWNTTNFLAIGDKSLASFGNAADDSGASYFFKPIQTSGRTIAYKYNADGSAAADFGNVPAWVPNTTIAGGNRYGNYLYYYADNGVTTGITQALIFDLSGNYIAGFGPACAGAPNDGTYTIVGLVGGLTISSIAGDDRGNMYVHSPVGGNQSFQKITRATNRALAGGAIHSSPVSLGGVTFFGADDGKVYAINASTGKAITGFPSDLTTAYSGTGSMPANAARQILGRLTFRTINSTDYLFLTTSDAYAVCLTAADGIVRWARSLPAGINVDTTPAVVDGGTLAASAVYVSFTDGSTNTGVVKLSALDGSALAPPASLLTSGSAYISSPSVNSAGVFVSVTGASAAAYRLNLSDLTPGLQLGTGLAAFGAPFMTPGYSTYPRVVIGTTTGGMGAYNANNGVVVYTPNDVVDITPSGSPSLSIPFVYNNIAYFGASDGVIYQANISDGSAPAGGYVFYTGASGTTVSGLAIDPIGTYGVPTAGLSLAPTLNFGDSAGRYHRVPLADASKAVVINVNNGAAFTTPTIDAATGAVLVGNADKYLYRFDRK